MNMDRYIFGWQRI